MLAKNESYGGIGDPSLERMGETISRERREDPKRMSDLNRAVEKASGLVERKPNRYLGDITPDPELAGMLKQVGQTQGVGPMFDKNTPGALKQLRWSIYELIERYDKEYNKYYSGNSISQQLKQEVERLFQEYTHS